MKRIFAVLVTIVFFSSLFVGCGIDNGPEENVTETERQVATYTVHAYVPHLWGTPKIWAWSEYAGAAFEEWPGVDMEPEGDGWYRCEVPKWADKVVINSLFGFAYTEDLAVQPRELWINVYKNSTATYDYEPFEPIDAGYLPEVQGAWEELSTTVDGTEGAAYCWALEKTVSDCIQMTVTLRVRMEEGAWGEDWQIWGRDDGYFHPMGTFEFSAAAGYSHTTQTVTFSRPETFDALIVIPSVFAGDGTMEFTVYDFYTE